MPTGQRVYARCRLLGSKFHICVGIRIVHSVAGNLQRVFGIAVAHSQTDAMYQQASFFLIQRIDTAVKVYLHHIVLHRHAVDREFDGRQAGASQHSFQPGGCIREYFTDCLGAPVAPAQPSNIRYELFAGCAHLIHGYLAEDLFKIGGGYHHAVLQRGDAPLAASFNQDIRNFADRAAICRRIHAMRVQRADHLELYFYNQRALRPLRGTHRIGTAAEIRRTAVDQCRGIAIPSGRRRTGQKLTGHTVAIGLYAGRHGIIEPFDDGFRLRIVRRSLRIGVNTLGLLFHRCQSLHRAANRQTERT